MLPLGLTRGALRLVAPGGRSGRVLATLTSPWVALPLWAAATWVWAIPAVFDYSAGHSLVHAIEHATLCRVSSLPNALTDLRARGVVVVGLDMGGSATIDRVDLTGPVAVVVGAEGKGLRKPVKGACDALARLPMPGPIGSLNASVAVAIALYEAVRQRGAP